MRHRTLFRHLHGPGLWGGREAGEGDGLVGREPWCPQSWPPLPILLSYSGCAGLYVQRRSSALPSSGALLLCPLPAEAVWALSLEGLACLPKASFRSEACFSTNRGVSAESKGLGHVGIPISVPALVCLPASGHERLPFTDVLGPVLVSVRPTARGRTM